MRRNGSLTFKSNAQVVNAACLQVSIDAVFSKYAISPAHGLTFEPVVYGTAALPRAFTLTNAGAFPFDFRLLNLSVPPPEAPAESPPGGKAAAKGVDKAASRAAPKSKGAAAPEAARGLPIGPFSVSPAEGTLAPGAAVAVEVAFTGEGRKVCREQLGIDVQHRDPSDHPQGIPFELCAESCVPGIVCDRPEAVFEEHAVVRELDPFAPRNCEFGVKDQVCCSFRVLTYVCCCSLWRTWQAWSNADTHRHNCVQLVMRTMVCCQKGCHAATGAQVQSCLARICQWLPDTVLLTLSLCSFAATMQ